LALIYSCSTFEFGTCPLWKLKDSRNPSTPEALGTINSKKKNASKLDAK
jgi:hypothetical protein